MSYPQPEQSDPYAAPEYAPPAAPEYAPPAAPEYAAPTYPENASSFPPGAEQYPYPGVAQPPGMYGNGYAPVYVTQETNGLAIASLVLSVVCLSIPGIAFGHIAMSQIRRSQQHGNPEGGYGFALAGLVIGYGVLAVFTIFWMLVILGAAATGFR